MPIVTMPDGTPVNMPDQIDPALGARLRAWHDTTPHEVTQGPQGFINGLAEMVGKGLGNMPAGVVSGVKDLVSRATGHGGAAPTAPTFPLSPNAQNVGESIAPVLHAAAAPYQPPPAVGKFIDENIAPVVGDLGAIAPAAGLASSGLGAVRSALTASDAAAAAEGPLGMRTGASSTVARNVAGPSAQPTVAAHNQGIADQRLGAQVGVTPGVPLGGKTPDGRSVLEAAKDVPNAVYRRVATNLPTGPMSPTATQMANSVGANDMIVHTPNTTNMIEAQKQRLLSGPLTGDEAIDAERALRYNGFKNQGLQDPENQALGSAQLKLSDAVHQHIQDTLPPNADVSMEQLTQARQSLAQINTLQGALKGNNVDLQGLAKIHRDNPGLFTGDMAQISDFADKHPEVTRLPPDTERFNPSGFSKDLASVDLKSPQSYVQPFFGAAARGRLTNTKMAPAASGLGADLAPIDRTPQAPPGMTSGPMGAPPATAGQPGQIPLADLLSHGIEHGPSPGLSAGPMGAPAPAGVPFEQNAAHMAGGLELAPQHTYGGQPANSDLGSVMSQGIPGGDMTRTGTRPTSRLSDTIDLEPHHLDLEQPLGQAFEQGQKDIFNGGVVNRGGNDVGSMQGGASPEAINRGTRNIVHWDGDHAKVISPDVNQIDQMTPRRGSIAIDEDTGKLVSSGNTPRSQVEGLLARWKARNGTP